MAKGLPRYNKSSNPIQSNVKCGAQFGSMQVQSLYSCLPRAAVDKFVSICSVCKKMVPQSHAEPLKPIIAKGFMQRGQVCHKSEGSTRKLANNFVPIISYYMQIDLVDVRHRPDGPYIAHYPIGTQKCCGSCTWAAEQCACLLRSAMTAAVGQWV